MGSDLVPVVRFLGLWDAVGSFFAPFDSGLVDFQRLGFGFKLTLAPNVVRCVHAMALDERRKSFRSLRVDKDKAERLWRLDLARRGKSFNRLTAVSLVVALVSPFLGVPVGTLIHNVAVGAIAVGFAGSILGAGAMRELPYVGDLWLGALVLTAGAVTFAATHSVFQIASRSLPDVWPWIGVFLAITAFKAVEAGAMVLWDAWERPSTWLNVARPASRKGKKSEKSPLAAMGSFVLSWPGQVVGVAVCIPLALGRRWLGEQPRYVGFIIGDYVDHGPREQPENYGIQQETTEVWFRGNHVDVGGGGTATLSEASLRWIHSQAASLSPALKLSDCFSTDHGPFPAGGISDKLDPYISSEVRKVLEGDRIHPSVELTGSATAPDERLRARLLFRLKHGPLESYPPRWVPVAEQPSPDGYRVAA